jgi:YD repeat-containing protein
LPISQKICAMYQPRTLCLCVLFLLFAFVPYAQVNLQTGSANFSLPMFEWKDEKSRLAATVALSYTSGNGLKVNDVASNIGQGWNLVAGGAITRMQVGEPDDQPAYDGNGTDSDKRKYPAGYLYAPVPAANGCPDALTKYPIYGSMNQVYTQRNIVGEDRQLDYFSFQFNGKAGLFVLDPSGVGRSLGDSRMKITFQLDPGTLSGLGIRTTIISFKIQDVDGLIYKFSRHSLTKVLEANYCDINLTAAQTQPKFNGGGVYHQAGFNNPQFVKPWVVGSWSLTEIEDALTHRKITLNYTTRTISNTAGADVSYTTDGDYSIITHKTSVTQSPDITSMVFPDGHTVAFTYGSNRVDLAGTQVLASVDITYQGRALSKYLLNTSYFILNRIGTPVSSYQRRVARLCLKSVKKIGVDLKEDSPPYIFDYYTGSNNADDFVPPPFFYAKDVWGFYNGSNSAGYNNETIPLNSLVSLLNNSQLKGLCFLRSGSSTIALNAKSGYAKNGLLRQIIYPTGGTLSWQYEQNTGVLNGSTTNVGGVHVTQTSSTDGGYSNGCANPLTTNYHYVMNGVGSAASLWGLEMPVNSMTTSSYYAPEHKKYKWSLSCAPFGCCYYKYTYPGILSQTQGVSLTDFQKFMTAVAPVLGIISIITTVMDVVTIVGGSTGVGAIVALVVDIIGGLLTLAITCLSNQSKNKTTTVYYNMDLNGISPLPAQFKRVEVIENPGTIGKTVHEFTSSDDYAIWVPTNPTFSARQRFAPWAYGLPKLITAYNAAGNKVKQTQHEYSWGWQTGSCHPGAPNCHPRDKVPLQLKSCKCMVTKNSSQRNTDWSDPVKYNDPASYRTSSTSDMLVDIYDLYTGRIELITTRERVFKPTDQAQYVETVTQYSYNGFNLSLSHVGVTQSDGSYTNKSIFYTDSYVESWDGTANAELNALYLNNIITEPVSIEEKVYGSFTNTKATIYTTLANGNIRPWKIWEHRFTQPDINGHNYDPDDQTYWGDYKTIQTFTYDASGNLTGLKDEGGRVVTNIYDYQDKYIVAAVINADPLIDKPAYSSFESYGFGGWQLTGIGPVYINSSGITGSRAFNLASNTFTASSLNTARPYTLSFWANNGNVVVSGGATLTKSAPAYHGYTYYEYDIAQGTTSVSVSGNAYIDELRLCPKTARMRTVTYDPLIGKTTECDENNRATYYEYDNLGRLRFIKDEQKNVVKMYEYNSASKQNGCPGTYYSRLTTETFTKSNCGAGYIGSEVTYTVPANKYTSTISQEDADAKVDNELFTLGQAYADANGSCILLYYNTVQSLTVTTQSCGPGYIGGSVTYTVPAGRYYTTVSQGAANQMALDEIAANAQAWANDPANAVCNVDTSPDWEWDNTSYYCQNINGELPPHLFVLERDMNPNSPSYNQTRWSDAGPQSECPAGNYYNTPQSGVFNRNDCSGGSAVTYTVPQGRYYSTVSMAAANQLAIDDVNANGQAYANANGTCCQPAFTFTNGIGYAANYVSLSNNNVSFTWVAGWPSGSSSFTLGTITSTCARPIATRVVPVMIGSSLVQVVISPSGTVIVSLLSGPMPSGSNYYALHGVYNLVTTTYYSAAATGYFTKNDCPSGQAGSTVQYSVAQYTYWSTVSQADADQQAQTALNANGQNYANANGTCSFTCTFTRNSSITSFYNSTLSSTSTTTSFNFVFNSPTSSYSSGSLGTINETGCRPTATRVVNVVDGATGSRTWQVVISPSGTVSVTVISGPAATNTGPPIIIVGSFTK